MKPELKIGRKVVAWEDNVDPVKGRYIKYGSHEQEHWVLDDTGSIMPFRHVKPDLDADPMNGDEVEVSDNNKKWIRAQYFGYDVNSDTHIVGLCQNGVISIAGHWKYARHPQPSKRERVIEFLNSYYYPCNAEKIADQIDKIYTEGS